MQLLPSVHLRIVFQEALQVSLLKHLGDVAIVLLDLVLSQFVLCFHVIPDRLESSKVKKNTNKVKNEV